VIFPEQHKPKDWCRLYLLYASASPKVIILRRGPTKWVQQIMWNTGTDTFTYGQWLRGDIKAYDCDVSPSGDYLIYFAQKYGVKDPAYETFTAISKTPTFTALTLWSLGDSWAGGGIFVDEQTLWLNHPEAKRAMHPDHPNTLFTLVPFPQDYSSRETSPERYRMFREGWVLIQEAERDPARMVVDKPKTQEEMVALLQNREALRAYLDEEQERSKKRRQIEVFKKPEIWERSSSHFPYTLVYKVVGYDRGGSTQVEFYLRHDASGKEELLPDVTQANFDHNDRLIMARYGALLSCDLGHELLQAHVLVDLNNQRPPEKFQYPGPSLRSF
jgi:hypothetical protein